MFRPILRDPCLRSGISTSPAAVPSAANVIDESLLAGLTKSRQSHCVHTLGQITLPSTWVGWPGEVGGWVWWWREDGGEEEMRRVGREGGR